MGRGSGRKKTQQGELTESARSKKAGGLCFLSSEVRESFGDEDGSKAELIMLRKFPGTSERQK